MSKQSGSQCERASEQTNKQSSKTTQNKPVSSLGWQPESATSIPMNHSGARPSPSFLSRSQPVCPPGWLTVLFARRRRLAPATQAKLKAHIAESDRSLLAALGCGRSERVAWAANWGLAFGCDAALRWAGLRNWEQRPLAQYAGRQ